MLAIKSVVDRLNKQANDPNCAKLPWKDDAERDAIAQKVQAGESPPELKGSIGEGPNHSNFLDRSSVKILSKFHQNSDENFLKY